MRALLVEHALAVSPAALMLRGANIITERAGTAGEALELARHDDFDVILLDMRLPGLAGVDFLRQLRAARIRTPVLALSGRATIATKVAAFHAGADDFLEITCDLAELLARVKAVVRRHCGYTQAVLRTGPLELNLDAKEASVAGRPVRLTPREYAVLELLILRKGKPVSKETFMNHLYGGDADEPEIKIIDVFVCKLRRKLADAGAPDLIGTLWGRGYMLREPGGAGADSLVAGRGYVAAEIECAA
jgi:two-component system, cell cycle response regulator CtrA